MRFLILMFSIILAINCGAAAAQDGKVLKSRYGEIKVGKGENGRPDALTFKGKLVARHADEFIKLYGLHQMAGRDVVLFGVNCGGSACTNDELSLLVIAPDGGTRLVEDEAFASVDGTQPKAGLVGGKLQIDLGYEKGKSKLAVFDGNSLMIQLKKPEFAGALPKNYCEWIFDSALDDCILAKQENPRCNDPQSTFPQVTARGMRAVDNHPAFKSAVFDEICVHVCKTGRAPRFEGFKDGFCSGKS